MPIPNEIALYSARHTFATDLLQASGDIVPVDDALGHTETKTTSRYLHRQPAGPRISSTNGIGTRAKKTAQFTSQSTSRNL